MGYQVLYKSYIALQWRAIKGVNSKYISEQQTSSLLLVAVFGVYEIRHEWIAEKQPAESHLKSDW